MENCDGHIFHRDQLGNRKLDQVQLLETGTRPTKQNNTHAVEKFNILGDLIISAF